MAWPHPAPGQSLILRDLTRLPEVEVVEFDSFLVHASNGQAYPWSQIRRGTTQNPAQQVEFEQRLRTEGEAWMRLALRFEQGDLEGAGQIASQGALGSLSPALQPAEPGSDQTTQQRIEQKYLLTRARLAHALQTGRQATGLLAYWQARTRQPLLSPERQQEWSQQLIAPETIDSPWHPSLLPIWWDPEDNVAGYRALETALADVDPIPIPLDCLLASLEIELDKLDSAKTRLQRLQPAASDDETLRHHLTIIAAALALAEDRPGEVEGLLQPLETPLSNYYRAVARNEMQPDTAAAILGWVSVAAEAGPDQASLAAAALSQAASASEARGDQESAEILRHELWRRYPHSYHARIEQRPVGPREALR